MKTFYNYESYIGKTINNLTIISIVKNKGYIRFKCRCVCGKIRNIISISVIRGVAKSCGCRKRNTTNLSGHRFGLWLVTDKHEQRLKDKNRNDYFWLCKCECGNESWVNTSKLISGLSLSCGCGSKKLISQKSKKKDGEAAFNMVYYQYKAVAKKYARCFELTKEQFLILSQKPCHYCGALPSNIRINRYNNGDFVYNGIDRVDSKKGYTINNCVPCCFWCNTMKSKYSVDEFLSHLRKILEYQNAQKPQKTKNVEVGEEDS